jgi:hypothetical protein
MSVEEQKVLLAKLMAEKDRAKQRAKEYRENNKAKCDAWSERARVRATILCQKAKLAGLVVSDEEIDKYIADMNK